jgi:hypothetical protein
MLSDTITIRPLDGAPVFCEADGCATPAVYLFLGKRQRDRARADEFGTNPRDGVFLMCSAYCHIHAIRSAAEAGVSLPLVRHRHAHAGG